MRKYRNHLFLSHLAQLGGVPLTKLASHYIMNLYTCHVADLIIRRTCVGAIEGYGRIAYVGCARMAPLDYFRR